jgi:hypothetical protein
MTPHRDPDRLIHTFVLEGAERLNDQVYDAVRAEIEHKRQRVVIGPWRMPNMNKLVPIGLGAAAVVVALVVAIPLLGPPASSGAGGAPTPSPSPTAQPSVASPPASPAGLPTGSHVLMDSQLGDGTPGLAMTVTIPAPGWDGERGGGILVKNESADPPDGAGMIVFANGSGWYVPGDPCGWASTVPDSRSTTVDELVAALAAQPSRDASKPVDITIDGYAGKAITLHTPDDAVFASCDRSLFCTLADPEHPDNNDPTDFCHRYSQGPGQIDNLWIVDVDGQLVVIDWTHYAATPADHVAEERAIVESATFD